MPIEAGMTLCVVDRETLRRRAPIRRQQLDEMRNRYHVHRLALFGSFLRDDFGPDSDIDVLVEFEPGRTPALGFFTLQDELAAIYGRRVDLNTPACLPSEFRDEVLAETKDIDIRP